MQGSITVRGTSCSGARDPLFWRLRPMITAGARTWKNFSLRGKVAVANRQRGQPKHPANNSSTLHATARVVFRNHPRPTSLVDSRKEASRLNSRYFSETWLLCSSSPARARCSWAGKRSQGPISGTKTVSPAWSLCRHQTCTNCALQSPRRKLLPMSSGAPSAPAASTR